MKMYKKSELTIVDGMLVSKDGDIIMPDNRIIDQANHLETLVQKSAYLATQPEATPMPLDGFKRVSIKDGDVEFTATTPLMDAKAQEAMALMGELDDVVTVDRANDMVREFKDLIRFVGQDFVVDCGDVIEFFDTPILGSVLELTKEDVIDAIAEVCGMAKENLTKREVLVDGEEVVSLLTNLAQDIHGLCDDMDNIKE